MTLADIKNFLKEKIECPNWYVGKRDKNIEQSITVYSTQGKSPRITLGGLNNSFYATKAVSILVHWGQYATPAENKAKEIYDCLFGQKGIIDGREVIMFDMRTDEPVSLGTDDNGCYEYVINLIIYYKK